MAAATSSAKEIFFKQHFASQALPFLLDPENPRDLHAVNAAFKSMHAAMQLEHPYRDALQRLKRKYPQMALEGFTAGSKRERFLGYFPKTVREKVKTAYAQCQARTSTLEAKYIAPIVMHNILLHSEPFLALLTFLLGFTPQSAAEKFLANREMHNRMRGLLAFSVGAVALLLLSDLVPVSEKFQLDFLDDCYEALKIASNIHLCCQPFQSENVLSKVYRVAKGSLAATVPVAKVAISRTKSLVERGASAVQNGIDTISALKNMFWGSFSVST